MTPRNLPRLTLVEVFMIIVVVGMLLCLLLPLLYVGRVQDHRPSCTNTLKQIGLGLWEYQDRWGCFPPSSTQAALGPTAPRRGSPEAGYSWLAFILPYIEEGLLDKQLDRDSGPPYDGHPTRASGLATSIGSYRCPSYRGPDLARAPEYAASPTGVTNYVALGATHLASLYGAETEPIGGPAHPNGTIYPGSATTLADMKDGASNTLLVCETREEDYAAWADGTTAAVVGLAEQSRPAFRQRDGVYVPVAGVRTTVNYGDANRNRHYLPAGLHSGGSPWTHGPSSNHPGIVNHLLGDGSVRSISEGIDAGVYMHAITRAGGEPAVELQRQ